LSTKGSIFLSTKDTKDTKFFVLEGLDFFVLEGLVFLSTKDTKGTKLF